MSNLTEQFSGLIGRVNGIENSLFDEEAPIVQILKIYQDIFVHPVYCSEETFVSEDIYSGEDQAGILQYLIEQLNYIGLGTGAPPQRLDELLEDEVIRKLITDLFLDDNILVAEVFLDETEGNGIDYTNTGIFRNGAEAINTGKLFTGGGINFAKDESNTLTVSYEITAGEV